MDLLRLKTLVHCLFPLLSRAQCFFTGRHFEWALGWPQTLGGIHSQTGARDRLQAFPRVFSRSNSNPVRRSAESKWACLPVLSIGHNPASLSHDSSQRNKMILDFGHETIAPSFISVIDFTIFLFI